MGLPVEAVAVVRAGGLGVAASSDGGDVAHREWGPLEGDGGSGGERGEGACGGTAGDGLPSRSVLEGEREGGAAA